MLIKQILFSITLSHLIINCVAFNKKSTCQTCHSIDSNKINVHLVPHSHDDVGWLKTVDQYYYGTKNHIQNVGIQYIIGSAIAALVGHPDRRFIQVETAFFWKWWHDQPEETRSVVIGLINNGQLEIINGAWSMNDEAAVNYQSVIDQFTWAFRFLNDSIGECARPKIGWQIDPFGHSREHASLLAQFGFQGLVIGRLDYRDKNRRRRNKELDFMWTTSANLNNSNLFTTMFPDFYVSEQNFCFDILCTNFDAIIGNDEFNLEAKVKEFSDILDNYHTFYGHSQMLMPMGGDFQYQAAAMNFANIDALIVGFKNHTKFNVFYSTPSCYIKAVNDEFEKSRTKLKQKTDDFFPYASAAHEVWAGYFTSRPTFKRFERIGNNILQAAKHLSSFSRVQGKETESSLQHLREIMGVMQHHDAITGTEKQAVANDYIKLLTEAIHKAEEAVGVTIGNLLKKDGTLNSLNLQLSSCLLSNISICETSSKSSQSIVAVYNPLSRLISHYIRLPVDDGFYQITGPDGNEVYDLFTSISNFSYVKHSTSPSEKNLVFHAKNIPPLGVKLYYIVKLSKESNKSENNDQNTVSSVKIDSNGKLSSININGRKLEVFQDFGYYSGEIHSGYRASGAYTFRPLEKSAVQLSSKANVTIQTGKLITEILQDFNKEVRQIIRIYQDKNIDYLEFDWLVGDLERKNGYGREIVTKFSFKNVNNKGVFYTDSNGREQIKRERNTRSDYEMNESDEPVASNYYPVTGKIVLKDAHNNMVVGVLNDRAQGGTSLKDGEIELMVHRRLTRDDAFGVNEVLNEEEYDVGLYARGQHYLVFGSMQPKDEVSTEARIRDLAQKKLLAPLVLVADATQSFDSIEKLQNIVNFQFSGLTRSLPENVQILTLEPWHNNILLLRLEHILEKYEDNYLSEPIVINLQELFTLFDITEIGETTLGANQWLDDFEREEKLHWPGYNNDNELIKLNISDPLNILLNPMQIRTFLIKVTAVIIK